MNYPRTFPTLLSAVLVLSLAIFPCCTTGYSGFENKRELDFNSDWRFHEGEAAGAEQPYFDDLEWRKLDLPHDWSIEDYSVQDSTHTGPFFKGLEKGEDVGYLRGGTGWYRKNFTLEQDDGSKQVILHFDGVQSSMKLWVNGEVVGEHVYGYTPFYFDITPYLLSAGQSNQVTVNVVNPEHNSRWYNGAGIYRNVKLSLVDPLHLDIWGMQVSTPQIGNKQAIVITNLNVYNNQDLDTSCQIILELLSPDGEEVVRTDQATALGPGENKQLSFETSVPIPDLWSPDHPVLYTARVTIQAGGEKVDEYSSTFGIRSIEYSADQGFLLNGEALLLKGACMHHDNGLLGAAAFTGAETRRIQIMKDNGYNAIRTSHNPPSNAFLEACDRIGMLVIDESFDMWARAKRPNDYHLHFDEWWRKDLETMLLRDRNHPSVVMWSFGNEINERADSSGLAIAAEMISLIKSLDSTRPVTQAICFFWDQPGRSWEDTYPAFKMLDIGGYNYQWRAYETDHSNDPTRIMAGTESFPLEAFENWRLVKKLPYVVGDFVWTGMDYIGESGIGHADFIRESSERGAFLQPWPWYISWCGDIDITGNKKPQSYYRDVVWEESSLELLVHEPLPEGTRESVSMWGWPRELKSWNWHGFEGTPLTVHVYSSYPEVRLELNGKDIGEEKISSESKLTAVFTVPFEPGELKAIGLKNGKEMISQSLSTTGPVSAIHLIPEQTEPVADRNEIVYIRVKGTDAKNLTVPDATNLIHVEVSGEGELLAAGNGQPTLQGSLKDNLFNLFRGEGLVIIRSTGKPGVISVKATAETPEVSAEITLSVK